VLLLDGEMPEADLRARLMNVAAAAERPVERGAFEIVAADRVKRGIGNLGSPAAQVCFGCPLLKNQFGAECQLRVLAV
jgi:hypothetical protein